MRKRGRINANASISPAHLSQKEDEKGFVSIEHNQQTKDPNKNPARVLFCIGNSKPIAAQAKAVLRLYYFHEVEQIDTHKKKIFNARTTHEIAPPVIGFNLGRNGPVSLKLDYYISRYHAHYAWR